MDDTEIATDLSISGTKCPTCCKVLNPAESLEHHIQMNHKRDVKRPHRCTECGMAFHKPRELTRHIRYKHTYEKPFMCPECDYTSVELSNVKRHMRRHAGDRPHQCPDCGYATLESSKLRRHMKIHSPGEKLLKCDVCNANFANNCALKGHQRIHTGSTQSYSCYKCSESCLRKIDLLSHMRQHHAEVSIDEQSDEMTCRLCSIRFTDFYSFSTHMKTHQENKCKVIPMQRKTESLAKSFKCEICGKCYKTKASLGNHMLLHTAILQHRLNQHGTSAESIRNFLIQLQLHKNMKYVELPNSTSPPSVGDEGSIVKAEEK